MNKRPSTQTGMADQVSHELSQAPSSGYKYDPSRLHKLITRVETRSPVSTAEWIHRLEDRINHLERRLDECQRQRS